MVAVDYYRGLLRDLIAGRPVVLTGGALRRHVVRNARELGACRMFVLDGDREALGADASAAYTDLNWRAVLDEFDPERVALITGSNFQSRSTFAHRRFVGARRPEWRRWEDKTEVLQLWERAGIALPPAAIAAATHDDLWAAAARLDEGLGTVWAGDHRDGEHHSGRHLRWVRTLAEATAASEYFASRCDQVRVMPFLDGMPCSIHGYVDADGVAVLRPVAQVIDRDDAAGTFIYRGCDLDWGPSDAVTASMRSSAHALGIALADASGYRGAFTLDGIATRTGFAPTETNTRFGAGLTLIAQRMPDLPLRLLHAFIADGTETEWRTADLEALILGRLTTRDETTSERSRRAVLLDLPLIEHRVLERPFGAR
jgi:hypothetical protein